MTTTAPTSRQRWLSHEVTPANWQDAIAHGDKLIAVAETGTICDVIDVQTGYMVTLRSRATNTVNTEHAASWVRSGYQFFQVPASEGQIGGGQT